jgi:hypothetical protein
MILCCGHCSARFDVSGCEPGTFVSCSCGDVLVIPELDSVEALVMIGKYVRRLAAEEGITLSSDAPADRWVFQRGSARIEVLFTPQDNALTVEAVIMALPDDGARRHALYHRVLELNHRATGEARFAIRSDALIVTFTRDVAGLDYIEFRSAVASVSRTADDYDDELRAAFLPDAATAAGDDEELDLSVLTARRSTSS